MALRWYSTVVESTDHRVLARWWAAALDWLVELGATIIDVGQPDDATWTVLADPEGNEFCVLSAREQ